MTYSINTPNTYSENPEEQINQEFQQMDKYIKSLPFSPQTINKFLYYVLGFQKREDTRITQNVTESELGAVRAEFEIASLLNKEAFNKLPQWWKSNDQQNA